MQLKLGGGQSETHHECESRREGDWLIFSCPHCPDYQRKYHLVSGEMQVRPGQDPTIQHHGSLVAPAYQAEIKQPN